MSWSFCPSMIYIYFFFFVQLEKSLNVWCGPFKKYNNHHNLEFSYQCVGGYFKGVASALMGLVRSTRCLKILLFDYNYFSLYGISSNI